MDSASKKWKGGGPGSNRRKHRKMLLDSEEVIRDPQLYQQHLHVASIFPLIIRKCTVSRGADPGAQVKWQESGRFVCLFIGEWATIDRNNMTFIQFHFRDWPTCKLFNYRSYKEYQSILTHLLIRIAQQCKDCRLVYDTIPRSGRACKWIIYACIRSHL